MYKNEQGKLSWDDLRVILAVARGGSLGRAASTLQVSHPTVFRRVRAIELALGVRLFERSSSGYAATDACAEIVALAEHVDAEISRVERSVAGRDERPAGLVRLTSTDTLMAGLLPPLLAQLRTTLPAIQLELGTGNNMFSLSKREADIALRPGGTPPDHLVGRRICAIASAIYAPANWGETAAPGQPWVVPDDSLSHLASAAWLRGQHLLERAAFASNSLLNMANAAAAGIGQAILPCYLGDTMPALRRRSPPMPQLASELWLLSHPDLRRVRRVQAVIEQLRAGLARHAELLEGRLPLAGP